MNNSPTASTAAAGQIHSLAAKLKLPGVIAHASCHTTSRRGSEGDDHFQPNCQGVLGGTLCFIHSSI